MEIGRGRIGDKSGLWDVTAMFVRARQGEFAALGVGKLIGSEQDRRLVEYFDAPFSQPRVEAFAPQDLERVTLPEQTRVYCLEPARGVWTIGRLLDDHGDAQLVRFPNDQTQLIENANVHVRWARAITDPTPFLAAQITESARFSEARLGFVRALLAQRAASFGMAGLISSTIELEPHQIEVVRRVLQDPMQRFLLADEVGLGKTIEAGVLIRQCVLETRGQGRVVVLVPHALVEQWREELRNKFALDDALDRTVHVLAFSSPDLVHHVASASMLVVDEAHHLSTAPNAGLYQLIASTAGSIERLILLSATPVLHNERSFLEMLHLIDPLTYRLDDEAAFRQRVEARGALADIVALLTPESAFYVDRALDQLAELFPENAWLQSEIATLREIVIRLPSPDDPELIEAMMRLKAHIGEVYRLDRRILRNRRRHVGGLTPGRGGAHVIEYRCPATGQMAAAIDRWRVDASEDEQSRVQACVALVERSLQYRAHAQTDGLDAHEYSDTLAALAHPEIFEVRFDALVAALETEMLDNEQWVVFCSHSITANIVAKRLEARGMWRVFRHAPGEFGWTQFVDAADAALLICDQSAEEGLNLQGSQRWAVHFDLPLNPNRIEQRLGRLDRYGSGEPVRSLVLLCTDHPIEQAWLDYLSNGLRVFDRSVASLQYVIDSTTRALSQSLLLEGAEAIGELARNSAGAGGEVERELRAIDRQEELDALGASGAEQFDALSESDSDWASIESNFRPWLENMLQFQRIPVNGEVGGMNAVFRYAYGVGSRHTLVPLQTFHDHCADALQLDPAHARRVQTYPYTYRRRTGVSRRGRAFRARLLRYGEAFVDGLAEMTAQDDRGRQMGMWRHLGDGYEIHGRADVYFRFDFLVESDLSHADQALDQAGRLSTRSGAAVRRRGDMAFGPRLETVWLDSEFLEVQEGELLTILNAPYRSEAGVQGGRDFNLNGERWRKLAGFGLPELVHWSELCVQARKRAEEIMRVRPALEAACAAAVQRMLTLDAGRLALLRARADRAGASEYDTSVERQESALSTALAKGLRRPSLWVESVSVIFLSRDMTVANALVRAR